MEYLHYMIRILRFDEAVYREVITRDKLSLLYTAINVGAFGLCYGLSATYFARSSSHDGEALSRRIFVLPWP